MKLKFCVVLAVAVFVISSMAGFEISAQNPVVEFDDVQENFWAKPAIDNWKDRGIIKGDGKIFNPNNNITRAEMVVILDNIFKYNLKKDNPFSDITEGAWYYDAFIKASAHGVIKGSFDENGKLAAWPNAPLTRAEAAVIFTNVFSLEVPSSYHSNFKDDNLPKWAKDSIFAMEAAGYIRGKGGGLFEPDSNLTRAEMVQIIDNVVKLYIDAPEEYNENVYGNVVISSPGVKLKNMKIEGNVYLAEGIGEGDVEFENVHVSGITFIRGGNSDGIKAVNSNLGIVKIEKDGLSLNLTEAEAGNLEEDMKEQDKEEQKPGEQDNKEQEPGEQGNEEQKPGEQGKEEQGPKEQDKKEQKPEEQDKEEQKPGEQDKEEQETDKEENGDSGYPDSADIVDY